MSIGDIHVAIGASILFQCRSRCRLVRGDWRDGIRGFGSGFVVKVHTPAAIRILSVRALPRLTARKGVFLLELFQPGHAVDFGVAFLTTYGGGEKSRFIADHVVVQG